MTPQTIHHTRSNSFPLPSIQHPLVTEVNEHLERLRASEATSASSSSISHKLNGFQDLLLDLYSTAKDVVLQTKESANELQSILRRRKNGELEFVSGVRKYLTSRKVVKKTIHKALENLKDQTKQIFSPAEDQETKAIVSMLREVEAITSSMFHYMLSLISGPKPASWSLVSKVLHHKRIAQDEAGRDMNEFEKVDAALKSLVSQKSSKSDNIMNLEMKNQLKDLDLCIQDLEDGYEYLFSLQDLHDCIDNLLQLPLTNEILAQEQQREYVDDLLNESVRLLDVCTTTKEVLLLAKESTLELQSILRRKRGATTELVNEVKKYLASRKAAKKAILKALKNLKNKENKKSSVYNENGAIVRL
ncbi:hypothetical protein PTKIN_Ptkin05aG0153400 [Pterospermum kingtungense]